MQEDTIVSIATPIGKGAISIIRMSGKESLEIALKVFFAKHLKKNNIIPRKMYFGDFKLENNAFEQCLMVFFKNPFSYTGEDVVEFQIHGGVLVAQKVLERCISAGAKIAEPGEFSKRAFINGKITLDKAEAIIGEINAESEGELLSSLQVTNGKLAEKILSAQEDIKLLLAELEVGMDYPDETEETKLKDDVFFRLEEIRKKIDEIIENSKNSKYLHNGINVALIGRTNVGKSSVMNTLLGEERAIVTDIQGTTRDQIQGSYFFEGIKINLVDTAGIRETTEKVESIGIEKSKKSLETADVVLFILDGSENMSADDERVLKLLKEKKTNFIVVINKSDKPRKIVNFENEIEISALKNENIEKLKKKIYENVIKNEIDFNKLVLTNERQYEILKEADKKLKKLIEKEIKSETLDVLSIQLKAIWQILGKITGKTENEDIIDLIFSKFCLGK